MTNPAGTDYDFTQICREGEVIMKKMAFAASVFFVLCSVQFAHAQFARGPRPRFFSEFKPVVGGWSQYEIKGKSGTASKMTIAVVEKEGDLYWYETVMEQGRGAKSITKVLVSGDPNDRENVKRMIVKAGSQSAMEIPVNKSRQMGRPEASAKGELIDKGAEKITVPAGTFTAQHVQLQQGNEVVETWIHKEVAPYGVIKSQSKEFEMVLLAYGTGAKTQITETPRRFEMPKMQTPRGAPRKGPPAQQSEEDEEEDDD